MNSISIENQEFEAIHVKTSHADVLLIKAKNGFLGCGYFDINVSNKNGEPVALVKGVKNYDDMLQAEVYCISEKAKELGTKIGMKGKEVLLLLNTI